MKNKICKILVFALAAIMLFGVVSSLAFSPYQTYTFSIDQEMLESPMAYKPHVSVSSAEIGLSSNSCTDIFCDAEGYVYIVDNANKKIIMLNENYGFVSEISSYVNEMGVTCTFNNPKGVYVTDPAKSQNPDLKDTRYMYVADSDSEGVASGNIIVFKYNSASAAYEYTRTIGKPESQVLEAGAFKPEAIAVDIYGRIFVVSRACYEGIIALSPEGDFNGFIGAQTVTYTFFEMIFNQFKDHEDYETEIQKNPDPFNNITVDDEGFIYVTISYTEAASLQKQLAAVTSKDPQFSPIKKYNSMGNHILKRNGFFDPGGEVQNFNEKDLSVITDVALGAEGAWSILDQKDSTIYTYDQNGQLLYAFGNKGVQLGSCANIDAMAYHKVAITNELGYQKMYDVFGDEVEIDTKGNIKFFNSAGSLVLTDKKGNIQETAPNADGEVFDSNGTLFKKTNDKGELYVVSTYAAFDSNENQIEFEDGAPVLAQYSPKQEYRLLLLDRSGQSGYNINVYTPTAYADAITYALYNENRHNHAETIDAWQAVLTQNNNFDLAYIGMGKAYYYQGNYEAAMEHLKSAYETSYYSLAYTEWRKDIIGKWMLLIIAVVIIVLVLVLKFLGWAKKKNKAASLKVGRKKYWEELIYAFHLVFHPFDGFWDLKHEKRGSVRAASTILGLTILAFFYQSVGQGYMFSPRPSTSNILVQVFSVAVPAMLWVIANWCLTTLFDGEGSFKDIYIATCYSLAPLPIFVTLGTVLTNVLTESESMIVTLLIGIAVVWMVLLLFFGMLVTHDYSMGKNFLTILATLLAAAVIIFIVVLFAGLVTKMYTFVDSLITEISNRV